MIAPLASNVFFYCSYNIKATDADAVRLVGVGAVTPYALFALAVIAPSCILTLSVRTV